MKFTKALIVEKSAEEFTAVASSETKDRHGDIVKQDGWDLKGFKDNPVLLFMHDHTKPIGKATKTWVDKTTGKARLMFKGVISSATEEARAAKQLMQEGILQSFSVGFMPLEMEGDTITKSELHEISLVSVGANADARLQATKSLQKAGFDEEVIKKVVPLSEDRTAELESDIAEMKKELASVKDTADMAVKGLKYLAPHRSKQEVVTERLHHSKIIARAADKLIDGVSSDKAAFHAKIIKRSSEMLIRSNKGDL